MTLLRHLLLLLAVCTPHAFGQTFTPSVDPFASASPATQHITPLETSDHTTMDQQRSMVNDLAQQHLGRRLGGGRDSDLAILQALLDRRAVTVTDTFLLQAMGVVLGDLYAAEFALKWVNYRDDAGRNRALQVGNGSDVLFPVTMISRRVEAGASVDVQAVYAKGVDIIRELQSRLQ